MWPKSPEDHLRHRDYHLAPSMALFQIADCCGNFGERIMPVDLRTQLAGLNQLRKELQIIAAYVHRHRGDIPAAEQGNGHEPRHVGEPRDSSLATVGKRTSEIRYRSVPNRVEDQVVVTPGTGEVGTGVVDDVVGAQRTDEVDIPSAGHAGDLGPI